MSIQSVPNDPVAAFVSAWNDLFGSAPTSVHLILATDIAADLRASAAYLAPGNAIYPVNSKKLGRWLARSADDSAILSARDGALYRFARVPTSSHVAAWRLLPEEVEPISEAA